MLENKGLGSTVVNSALANKKDGGNKMELKDFMEKEPALYNQIVKDAQAGAVTNERARIQAINALSRPGVENQIKEGIENGLSVGEVAINILNAQVAINAAQGEALKKDAEESGVNDVKSVSAPQNNNDQGDRKSTRLNSSH